MFLFFIPQWDRLHKALLSQMSENEKANRDRAICKTEEKLFAD
jgi:hypothetical protein